MMQLNAWSALVLSTLLLSSPLWAQKPPHLRTPFIENWGQVSPATLERQASEFDGTYFLEGPGDKKEIALTYDDGPSEDTPALLDLLKKENVKATFFWQGQNIERYPEIARRAVAEGHTLANHSFSHPNLSKMEEGGFWWSTQLLKTQQIFQKVVGFQPCMMRPPYGFLSDTQVKTLKTQNMKAILWSVDTADWYHTHINPQNDVASREIVNVIKKYIHPEAIVLMHDAGGRGRKPSIMATAEVIPLLRKQGYQFVTVDHLLNLPAKQASAGAQKDVPFSMAELSQHFIDTVNEPSAEKRLSLWPKVLTPKSRQVGADFLMVGVDGYEAFVKGIYADYPGWHLQFDGAPVQIGDQGLLVWRMIDAKGGTINHGIATMQQAADGRLEQMNVLVGRSLSH